MSVIVRSYTLDDYEALLDVQRESFPPPFPEELWWKREQIAAHVATYPEGAMVAVCDGEIVGSATSLLVTHTGKPHTWEDVSDRGYIRGSHDPNGDSLYGIDLCVKPAYRSRGVAAALYDARKQLVVRSGLKRFLAGCRIPGYHRYADRMSADEYVRRVVAGDIRDLVLSFMLRQGLTPLQLLEHYVEDEESLHYAVLVEWAHPKGV
ncbi:GNAT family N-acetyltransferase [Paenibacillus flagellatus]|uniref:GNAT family N-acetyltransferase n=1 Tax=Paenibacillus flagellatus TaxID=2211139 RepID=A0A2V5K455_9BACL|nr:GNAT family N-acetyltransferase [Paenibacillus flagellatus]PYI53472.1 GNAT family N-acetyltransferase [Paenibacillus flagellatus]